MSLRFLWTFPLHFLNRLGAPVPFFLFTCLGLPGCQENSLEHPLKTTRLKEVSPFSFALLPEHTTFTPSHGSVGMGSPVLHNPHPIWQHLAETEAPAEDQLFLIHPLPFPQAAPPASFRAQNLFFVLPESFGEATLQTAYFFLQVFEPAPGGHHQLLWTTPLEQVIHEKHQRRWFFSLTDVFKSVPKEKLTLAQWHQLSLHLSFADLPPRLIQIGFHLLPPLPPLEIKSIQPQLSLLGQPPTAFTTPATAFQEGLRAGQLWAQEYCVQNPSDETLLLWWKAQPSSEEALRSEVTFSFPKILSPEFYHWTSHSVPLSLGLKPGLIRSVATREGIQDPVALPPSSSSASAWQPIFLPPQENRCFSLLLLPSLEQRSFFHLPAPQETTLSWEKPCAFQEQYRRFLQQHTPKLTQSLEELWEQILTPLRTPEPPGGLYQDAFQTQLQLPWSVTSLRFFGRFSIEWAISHELLTQKVTPFREDWGFFSFLKPSPHSIALELTQPPLPPMRLHGSSPAFQETGPISGPMY